MVSAQARRIPVAMFCISAVVILAVGAWYRVDGQTFPVASGRATATGWEYRFVSIVDILRGKGDPNAIAIGWREGTAMPEQIEAKANELGKDRWELVQVDGKGLYFKRPRSIEPDR